MDNRLWKYIINYAKRGRGKVAPNPEVGAIIIKKGEIIGKGNHEYFGGPHAEVNAILDAQKSGYSVEDSQMYVTLEPCCHTHKKTPPCTNLLIQKKISKVCILFRDPNPEVLGKGADKLIKNNIEVEYALPKIQKEYSNFYEIFSYTIKNKTPFCTLKIAESKDGFIAKHNEQTQITGAECREYTLALRDKHQSTLVGVNTVITDNPTLKGKDTQPLRIVLDPSGKLSEYRDYNFFRDENYLIFTTPPGKKRLDIIFPNKQSICVSYKNKNFDIQEIKKYLYTRDINSIFIEGGSKTAHEFIVQKEVQKIIRYQSPLILEDGVVGIHTILSESDYNIDSSFALGKDLVELWRS